MSKWKQKLKIVFTVDLIAVGAMHVLNQMISSSAVLKNILKPGSGKRYAWKYGDIFYRKVGEGKPLLLIHDLNPISSGYEWNQVEDKLKENHTVYIIDLLGCGRSEKPGLTYTNYLYVQMISDFIRDVIGEMTDVAATGLSSSFVVMAAYQDPSLIGKILMINPEGLGKLEQIPDQKSKIMQTIMAIPVIGTTIYHIAYCRQNVEYLLTEKYLYNPFRVPQRYIDAYYESAHYGQGNGKYLLSCLDGFYLNANIRTVLGKLDQKMEILYGEKQENGKEIAESYRKENSSILLVPIYGTKLLPQLETPEETLTQIEKFIDAD